MNHQVANLGIQRQDCQKWTCPWSQPLIFHPQLGWCQWTFLLAHHGSPCLFLGRSKFLKAISSCILTVNNPLGIHIFGIGVSTVPYFLMFFSIDQLFEAHSSTSWDVCTVQSYLQCFLCHSILDEFYLHCTFCCCNLMCCRIWAILFFSKLTERKNTSIARQEQQFVLFLSQFKLLIIYKWLNHHFYHKLYGPWLPVRKTLNNNRVFNLITQY